MTDGRWIAVRVDDDIHAALQDEAFRKSRAQNRRVGIAEIVRGTLLAHVARVKGKVMIKFMLYVILFLLCWPVALLIGAIWLVLAIIGLAVRFVEWAILLTAK